ncbi:MAG: putative metalloendopeptidase [Ilumatobacteraceae bacterium]|nr:putative metalloendopeptidase [Ilumatobacteraceae bacterium]
MAKHRGIGLVFALLVGLLPSTAVGVARADDGSGSAEDAAREIAAARARANAAADAYFQAESKVELLGDQKDRLDAQTAEMETQVEGLKKSVESVVVDRYIGAGTTGIDLLSGTVGPTESAQTAELVSVINDTSSTSLDDYDALLAQLQQQKDKTDKVTKAYAAAQADFKNKEKIADDQVEQLKVVEKDRLNDEAVVRALDAQRQKDVEVYTKAATDKARADQANAVAAALASEGGGSDGGDDGEGIDTGNVASGSSVGGTTGGGGVGGHPAAGVGTVYGAGDTWVCPLQGAPYAFSDTFGAPRSGGRLHQGVDMIAARGTQIVAVVDGVATPKQNTLGGNTISLAGADGNRYYYAHLDSYGTTGPVVKGTVIGYVGDTGDAKYSTPHLHLEIHPGGGPAVDPTPTVAANC